MKNNSLNQVEPKGKALIPLFVFLFLYLGVGLWLTYLGVEMAFYEFPAPIAALIGVVVAVIMAKGTIEERLQTFIKGAGEEGIIVMCMIYLLAGAFSAVVEGMGGVESTVNLGLTLVPPRLILPGLFIISAFISLAMGTSMGTIGAVAPIAIGLSEEVGFSLPLIMGIVIGGAMFGDNLSIISDTTIAATQTQGVKMRDKFKMNFMIVLPAALITIIILLFVGDGGIIEEDYNFQLIKVLPYIFVLVFALLGTNVFIVLFTGLVLAGLIGIAYGDFTPLELTQVSYEGFTGMSEVFFLSMFAGGLAAMIRKEGGLAYLVEQISRRIKTKKGAELGIGALASAADICTANNTVAIIVSGPLAQNIAQENGVDMRRSASLLDIFAASFQGMLPYGAQILLAGSLAGISPLSIIPNLHYNFLMLACVLIAIYLGIPKLATEKTTDN
ncbi:Na+/H+ antiporter NhaC family protein [Natranaerobius thermophilus]|uniref:Na+/H+ antiporter NhaC n=1 Tax=Natranaerobius thermophilus (strain ATCC BAA-1301 / DSM 18059 / JW/NM-WN-LF) TaxID=457570 RepID=B2A2C8_NATTJ|nr:Na+/H+ antiporter NhaC family protein [Natranaerobius thermophilus]ACB86234.1 Na+/H+ antiporter NhaC [Natranaerobius thermophilus JW/NM-WN-LF]